MCWKYTVLEIPAYVTHMPQITNKNMLIVIDSYY